MALYLEVLPSNTTSKSILIFHNTAFDQYARIFRVERRLIVKIRALLHSLAMRWWEPRYAERFDHCVAVSEADQNLLKEMNPRLQLDVIPNGVDTQLYQLLPRESTPPALLFIGKMSYSANVDAIIYFCQEILPIIRRTISDISVWVVGSNPTPAVKQLEGDGVRVTGFVDEIEPYYKKSSVCIVPLRAGGGSRLKIAEAMSLGRPVVSTSIGCEGIEVEDGKHLLIADNPEQFAEQTVRLLQDKDLYNHIVHNARELVVNHYDWDALTAQMMQIYDNLLE